MERRDTRCARCICSSKLSKRKTPSETWVIEAVTNCLGRMGWSMTDERDICSLHDMEIERCWNTPEPAPMCVSIDLGCASYSCSSARRATANRHFRGRPLSNMINRQATTLPWSHTPAPPPPFYGWQTSHLQYWNLRLGVHLRIRHVHRFLALLMEIAASWYRVLQMLHPPPPPHHLHCCRVLHLSATQWDCCTRLFNNIQRTLAKPLDRR